MVFITESWFWRGTQSAIFYYISCTPWLEHRYKKKRRRDAEECRKDNETIVISEQPGIVVQPAPFETNQTWAHEIIQGPGPPKRWLKDNSYFKNIGKAKCEEQQDGTKQRSRADTNLSTISPAKSDWTAFNSSASTAAQTTTPPQRATEPLRNVSNQQSDVVDLPWLPEVGHELSLLTFDDTTQARSSWPGAIVHPVKSNHTNALLNNRSDTTGSQRTSLESTSSSEILQPRPRPSVERRLSNAMDGFKDAMRAALHPDHWNWIRYDRDDEILPTFRPKVKSMWENVKGNMNVISDDVAARIRQLEANEPQPEREIESWKRGTHPAVNDLHPPIVSQLPYSREEAKWMLLPPASADVMMGRRRPDLFDDAERRPLCIMGREAPEVSTAQATVSNEGEVQSELCDSDEDAWDIESRTHLQKPQRAFLRQHHRGSSLPPPILTYHSDG